MIQNGWRLCAWILFLSIGILSAIYWPVYPYFLDHYYHLSVAMGFQEAGGPVLTAFWESAPEGRPHLYPPLFHLICLPALILGCDPIVLAKIWCVVLLPLCLGSAWWVLSRISSHRTACLTVLALSIPYPFYLGCINHPPASLALVVILGLAFAISRKRLLAAGLLMGAAFWLHAGLPWLVGLGLVLFGWMEPTFRRSAWGALCIGLLAAAPWLLHLAQHASLLKLQPRGEERFLEIPIALLVLGGMGWIVAVRHKGMDRFWAALAVGFLPMGLAYQFRFFATQGLFPWLILSGMALDGLARKLPRPVFVLGVTMLVFLAPTLERSSSGWHLEWGDSTPLRLASGRVNEGRARALSLFSPKLMDPIAKEVQAHTRPDELIYSNLPYFAGMIRVTTGRSITNRMLREMPDRPLEEEIRPARLIVWVKDPDRVKDDIPPLSLQALALQYHLRPLARTELAYIYFNPRGDGLRRVGPPVMPWQVAMGLVILGLGGIAWDLRRSRLIP